jgi:RimJ/RimL family protein N-acetyltransferase
MKPVTLISGDVTVTNEFENLKIALMNLWKWSSNPKVKKFVFDANTPVSKKDFTTLYLMQLKSFYDARDKNIEQGAEFENDPIPYFVILCQGSCVGFISTFNGMLFVIIEEGFWRRKIGTTAVKLICRYIIEEGNYHRVSAFFSKSNWVAKKFFTSIGFKTEGVLREALKFDNSYVDAFMMSLVETDMLEWETPEVEEKEEPEVQESAEVPIEEDSGIRE